MDFSDQYVLGDLGDLWNPSMNEYDVSSSMGPITTDVQFLNIDDSTVVFKYQSRVRKEAKQRLKNAEVQILVTSPYDVKTIKVWVQREEKAADLFVYNVGRVEFAARDIVFKGTQLLENGFGTKSLYEIDLDSIYYDNPYDKRPVYKLAKTDMLNRNRFQVVIQVVFRDNSLSSEFVSSAFYCCTQPKSGTKRKTRSTDGGKQYGKEWNDPEFYNNSQVIDYFEANEAVIGNLEVKGTLQSPKMKADIAYHFDVNHSEFQKTLTEGDVVGLNTNADGETSIIELSSKNMRTIIQAGVISRSAFFEGNIPAEKVSTDKICVMGIVRVKVVGNVRNGERVYASTSFPGRAVAESHSLHVDDDILLGIAMESSDGKDHQAETLVRCFVSFLCGINAGYFSQKAHDLEIRTDANIEKVVHQKWKELKKMVMHWFLIFIFFTILLCIVLFASNYFS
ncbi:Hypothetical predicted protein [Paramuricea clavata]|uniref:Uncharacterized protein n=1 Tax=Paramuricea clavata TaxID=317549 RepID=A0A7D9DIM3_PARCT|nr:Hypothetical predicted protein [Paramuricea clavata]